MEDPDFMSLPEISRRRLAAASLTLLALAGCNALPTGPRQVNISEAQLLERIATRFPVKQRYLGLLETTLDQPRLRLRPEENRVGTMVNYLIALPLPGQSDIKGQLELSYGLRFEPSDTTLRLTQAVRQRSVSPSLSKSAGAFGLGSAPVGTGARKDPKSPVPSARLRNTRRSSLTSLTVVRSR